MKALVLSVGGDRIGYLGGVASYLFDHGADYQILCGSSAGSIIAGVAAQYDEPQEASAHILNALRLMRRRDFVQHHKPFSILHGLWEPSLYSTKGIGRLVADNISEERLLFCKRKLGVVATEITSGEVRVFEKGDSQILKAIQASAAFPFMFSPVEMYGGLWADGGLRSMSPVGAALALGATAIDVVLTSSKEDSRRDWGRPNAIEMAMRSIEILMDEALDREMENLELRQQLSMATTGDLLGKDFHYRVIRPETELPGGSLKFKPEDVEETIRRGQRDAEAAGWV